MLEDLMTDNMRQTVGDTIAANPSVMLDQVSLRLGVPEGVVAALLDEEMCTILPATRFEQVWQTMTRWEQITFIAVTPGAIVEVKGRLPKGKSGHGFFNIGEENNPLAGHIKAEDIWIICLVSKPFMELESHSVRFYNQKGELMLAIYVGREGKELIPSVRRGFMALKRLANREAA